MKHLLIMRHAKSSWGNAYRMDHERPLNERGQRDAPRMGQLLKDEKLVPDLIISSTAERALATAEMAALACDFQGELVPTRRLYHAAADTYLTILRDVDDRYTCVMVVGHNPGMETLVQNLTGHQAQFTTANIAHVQFAFESWSQLTSDATGKLLGLWRPKELA